jgi:hypothetical protein
MRVSVFGTELNGTVFRSTLKRNHENMLSWNHQERNISPP